MLLMLFLQRLGLDRRSKGPNDGGWVLQELQELVDWPVYLLIWPVT